MQANIKATKREHSDIKLLFTVLVWFIGHAAGVQTPKASMAKMGKEISKVISC